MPNIKLQWYHFLIITVAVAVAGGYIILKNRESKDLKNLSKKNKDKLNEFGDRVMELENSNRSKDKIIEELESIIEDFNEDTPSLELKLVDEVPVGFTATELNELAEVEDIPSEGKSEKNADVEQPEENIYTDEKIPWPWEKDKLHFIFNQLSSLNHEGVPYLTEEEIDIFLRNNFSCFSDKPTGQIFTPNIKHKYTFEYFFYQVFASFKLKSTDIDMYANLLINNFTQWRSSNLKTLKKNMGRQGRQIKSRPKLEASPHHIVLEVPS